MVDWTERHLRLVRPATLQPANLGPAETRESPTTSSGMRVLMGDRAADYRSDRHTVVALGVFDGVHSGHRELVSRAVQAAHERGADAVVLTFDPHPAIVLGLGRLPGYLTTIGEKAAVLASLGVDTLVVQPFDHVVAGQSPEEFVRLRLAGGLYAAEVVIGFNFTFGRGGIGNPQTLHALGAKHGIATTVMPPVTLDGTVVSSTAIRQALLDGEIDTANRLLGREYELSGSIVRGCGRGNGGRRAVELRLPLGKLLPANGTYSGWATIYGSEWPAIAAVRGSTTPAGEEQRIIVSSANAGIVWSGREMTFRFTARLS